MSHKQLISLKHIIEEDFNDYKKPSLFIAMPTCTFKCDKDCGERVCQNSALANSPTIYMNIVDILDSYMKNKLTEAVVFGGLEPMDSFDELYEFIKYMRYAYKCDDDIVIYIGYNQSEITWKIAKLKKFKNIIVKFGRYKPNRPSRFDNLIGVYLASPNQYAKIIS